MAILNNSNAISSGGYDINNSLRLRRSATAYLSRTPSSTTNRQIGTLSLWFKRGQLGVRSAVACWEDTSTGNGHTIEIGSDDKLTFYNSGTSAAVDIITTQVFRDPSAWYHFVIAFDTTQATAANRVKMYINGTQITAFGTATYPSQNANLSFNTNNPSSIGRRFVANTDMYFDGYLADINWIDGSAKTPSDFGETDTTTGVWKPKAYTSTYGTNGFYLKFSDIATTSGSNAGLGKDFSGNGNYWTTNNISVTAGTTYDAMIDSPTNTSATVANYAVMNPLWKSSNIILAGANLNVTSSGNGGSSLSTIAMESGKYYCELRLNSSTDATIIGIANSSFNPTTSTISSANAVGYYTSNGDKFVNGTQTAYGASCASGDIVGIAVDITAGTVTFYKNNTSQGAITHGLTGPFYFATSDASSGSNIDQSWNFGQRPFSYTPPTGFVALNTYNLPTPTILQGNKYMDATTYTGNGTTNRTVVNAAPFKPDLVWVKDRSNVASHLLVDSVRGITSVLYSNSTLAQQTGTAIAAINSNGFSVNEPNTGADSSNINARTYVGWQWQAGQGSTTTGTGTGGITSVTQSVNTTAGFSIVTYTGSGANGTVTHGLGVAPKMIIFKRRSAAANWAVYHASIGNTGALALDLTIATDTNILYFNNTSPTSSVFTIGAGGTGNNASGSTYVAYCWAEIAGFSKFGSYTGNGSTDGPFVYTGFRPKYILIKRTDTTASWVVMDTSRGLYNASYYYLLPNLTDADSGPIAMDFLSNGFKLRLTSATWNASGGTYIYMAFAENPFKNANAR